ncbi:ABC transporter ATP-binding protein, partial [Prevotella aurantiaca]
MKISLEQLSVGYKGFAPVVTDINVEIKSGELTCLIGSNGIGKSTLLKTLTGFLPKLSGRLLLDGRDIDLLSQRERAKYISIVLTYKTDVQNLNVTEMVGMGRMPYTGFWGKLIDNDQKIVAEAINMLGINHLKNRMVQTLSDGERQKVMIAKALAQQTPII